MPAQRNNDSENKRAQRVDRKARSLKTAKSNEYWMYGLHSVAAALQNRKRHCSRLLATKEALATLQAVLPNPILSKPALPNPILPNPILPKPALLTSQREALPSALSSAENTPNVEIVQRAKIDALFPQQSAHQSLALLCQPLASPPLAEILASKSYLDGEKSYIVVLDRAQDPRNIGAVLRSAGFFGVKAVLLASGHTPKENAVMAKAASGALEVVPVLRLNLAQALRKLGGEADKKKSMKKTQNDEKQQNFNNQPLSNQPFSTQPWLRIALQDASHKDASHEVLAWGEQAESLKEVTKIALVFGAEDVGIRPLVQKQCDISLYLQNNTASKDSSKVPIASLNLSNAVAATLALLAQQNRNDT